MGQQKRLRGAVEESWVGQVLWICTKMLSPRKLGGGDPLGRLKRPEKKTGRKIKIDFLHSSLIWPLEMD